MKTITEKEELRLAALHRFAVLDTLPEQTYDDITLLASHICQAPIALISLVDKNRQWFKSRIGLDADETPREYSFCSHAIQKPDEVMIVSDAQQDKRFADNPLVLGDPRIRFYAGAPLLTRDNEALGTLCVIDTVPRDLTKAEQEALEALARQVMSQMELSILLRENEEYLRSLVAPGVVTSNGESVADMSVLEQIDSLHRARDWHEAILNSADFTIISTDTNGLITTCNAGALRKLGYEADELIGKATPAIWHDRQEVTRRAEELTQELGQRIEPGFETFVAIARQGQIDENDWTYIRKDGGRFTVRLSVTALRDDDRQIHGFLGVGKDITEQKQAETALSESQQRFEALMNNSPILAYLKDKDGYYVYVNEPLLRSFGRAREEFIGHCDAEIWTPEVYEVLRRHDLNVLTGDEVVSLEETVPTADGAETIWLSYKFPLVDSQGRKYLGGVSIDISERKYYEQQLEEYQSQLESAVERLEELSITDGLTQLKNHSAFVNRLTEEVSRAERYQQPLSLLMLDIDKFKDYNDSFGHPEGDQVLRRVANLLQEEARPSDFAARYGGEEFAFILPNTALPGAMNVAERIRQSIEQETWANSRITISIGAAQLRDGQAENQLIKAADAALYDAKRAGRNCVKSAASASTQ